MNTSIIICELTSYLRFSAILFRNLYTNDENLCLCVCIKFLSLEEKNQISSKNKGSFKKIPLFLFFLKSDYLKNQLLNWQPIQIY